MTDAAQTAVTGRHLPALSGLRGLAVLGVIGYHLELGWASGGYLGVDLFFVLSGFLITTLLLEEWVANGTIRLGSFWGRRARRLLPALFLMVIGLGVYLILNARLSGAGANGQVNLPGLRGDAIATLLYVSNWHAIYSHQSYFARFDLLSPLAHTWSLAIEEQFYLVWPPLLVLLLRRAGKSWRRVGLAVAVVVGLASAGLMALLFHYGVSPFRVYDGTDTRLFDLMAGAVVAFLVAARPQPAPRTQRALHVAAPIAALVLGAFWVTSGSPGALPTNFMFEGGFLLCAALAAVVIADARLLVPGWFARLLAIRPLHFLGTISYGVYLWHWPILLYLSGARTGLSRGPLDAVRVVVTLLVATASYYLVEQPIRRMTFRGAWRQWLAPLAGGLTAAAVLVVATIPAVADPGKVASTGRDTVAKGSAVSGSGGYQHEVPITLPPGTRLSPAHPLRVMVLGDSVMHDASIAITAALTATGEVKVTTKTIDGFGLSTATNWPTVIPSLIRTTRAQLIVASWSWDQDGPTTPNALRQPRQYAALLRRAIRVMLTPGDGVAGVIFTQFPQVGMFTNPNPATQKIDNDARIAGTNAWNNIAASMSSSFPGKVMYLPVGNSLLLDGRYATWLPPVGNPNAPRSQWIRARKLDNVHLCPEGSERYGSALLADLTAIFRLPPADPSWTHGSWTSNPDFNTPPGSCPDDHPPG